jgi:5-methylcytosine-specific restriction endonuclease McrA
MGEFPDEVVIAALNRAGGRCECQRTNRDCLYRHSYFRCGEIGLTLDNRGTRWQAHHKTSVDAGGDDTLSNCEILCLNCHQATRTFG